MVKSLMMGEYMLDWLHILLTEWPEVGSEERVCHLLAGVAIHPSSDDEGVRKPACSTWQLEREQAMNLSHHSCV